jgi:hypothetical protein
MKNERTDTADIIIGLLIGFVVCAAEPGPAAVIAWLRGAVL